MVAGVLLCYYYDVAKRLPGCCMWLLSCYCLSIVWLGYSGWILGYWPGGYYAVIRWLLGCSCGFYGVARWMLGCSGRFLGRC